MTVNPRAAYGEALAAGIACAVLIMGAGPVPAQVDRATRAMDSDWPLHGRTTDEQRFSPLTAINSRNVDQLGLAWSFELTTDRGQEATPLVVDGVLYATSSWSIVHALDAATGRLLWTFDPQVPRATGVKASSTYR